MPRINKEQFTQRYENKEISLAGVNTSGAGRDLTQVGMPLDTLAKADLNNDGKIAGKDEIARLFNQVDSFDRNGSSRSFETTFRGGAATRAGKVVNVLDLLFKRSVSIPSSSPRAPWGPAIPAGPTVVAGPSGTTPSSLLLLSGPVGTGLRNNPQDVRAVQQRLKDLGFAIDVDGKFGLQTRGSLKTYEAMLRGKSDARTMPGWVKPGSALHKILLSDEAPTWVKIPKRGEGFINSDTDGFRHGSQELVDVILDAGIRYKAGHMTDNLSASVMSLNDASIRNGGPTRDHETHHNGLDMDIRLPTTSGAHGTTVGSSDYDRKATYAMVEALASDPRTERIILTDPTLIRQAHDNGELWASKLETGGRVHKNHIHLDVKAPDNPLRR